MIEFVQKVEAAIKINPDSAPSSIRGFFEKYGGTEADLNSVVTVGEKIVEAGFAFAGIAALFMFIYGGVMAYVLSYGDEEHIKKGTQTMVWSFVGLVIIATTYTIYYIIVNSLQ